MLEKLMQKNPPHSLPEITLKAVVLSIILAMVLAAANAYLGLKVGTTISASIPAAVISMGVLRLFRRHNILENNIVQTAASAGEAVVAAIIFLMPVMLILKFWTDFHYWPTVFIASIGGILGVLFSVPLRRVLLNDKSLRFPEGVAIGNVLKVSGEGAGHLKELILGSGVSAFISFCQTGLQIVAGSSEVWWRTGSLIFGFGAGFNPAFLAAGYIVGFEVSISLIVGVVIGWLIGIPVLSHFYPMPSTLSPVDAAMTLWSKHLRFVGVGTMLVGGMWTLLNLIKPISQGLRSSFVSLRALTHEKITHDPHEQDLPMSLVLLGLFVTIFLLYFLYSYLLHIQGLAISNSHEVVLISAAIIYTFVAGFIVTSLCGYFAGLVGSTNNPLSGLMLSVVLFASLIIALLSSSLISGMLDAASVLKPAMIVVVVSGVVAASAAIMADNIQDLKAGRMVGATPWKQQLMLIVGTIAASLIIPPILQLLFNAYGMAGIYPHPGMDPKQMLAAPQASLMAAVIDGVFTHQLNWLLILVGAGIALLCIIADYFLKRVNIRLLVLAVGLGIYLPLDSSTPLIFGGVAALILQRLLEKREKSSSHREQRIKAANQRGLILACGLVAGASLMGVILAIPFAIAQSSDILKIMPDSLTRLSEIFAAIISVLIFVWFNRVQR